MRNIYFIFCSFVLLSCVPSGRKNDALFVASIVLEEDVVMERSQLISSVQNDSYDLWAQLDEDSNFIWLYKDNNWVRENRSVANSLCPMEEFFKGAWYHLHGGDTVSIHTDKSPYVLPKEIEEYYFVVDEVKGDTVVLAPISCPYNEDGDIIGFERLKDYPKIEHIWKEGLNLKKDNFIFE